MHVEHHGLAGQRVVEVEFDHVLVGRGHGGGRAGAAGRGQPGQLHGIADRQVHVVGHVLQQHLADDVHLAVGDALQLAGISTPSGASAGATVTAVDDDSVELDFNHPLAGKAVVFDVQILGVL